jgi:hypothetical protein
MLMVAPVGASAFCAQHYRGMLQRFRLDKYNDDDNDDDDNNNNNNNNNLYQPLALASH